MPRTYQSTVRYGVTSSDPYGPGASTVASLRALLESLAQRDEARLALLQGALGAIPATAALSLLRTTFTDHGERNKAFGIYGSLAVVGGAVGLLLGGVLTAYLTWRGCLYVDIAFAVPASLGASTLPHHQDHGSRLKLDVPGTVTAAYLLGQPASTSASAGRD
jgi:MFS family permease